MPLDGGSDSHVPKSSERGHLGKIGSLAPRGGRHSGLLTPPCSGSGSFGKRSIKTPSIHHYCNTINGGVIITGSMSARSLLTQRDLSIVLTAHQVGPLTVDQIRLRFFPTNTAGARAACYRRVSLLIRNGYLAANYMPFLANTGRGRALLTLGPQGRLLVSQLLGVPRSEIGRVRLDSPVVCKI